MNEIIFERFKVEHFVVKHEVHCFIWNAKTLLKTSNNAFILYSCPPNFFRPNLGM